MTNMLNIAKSGIYASQMALNTTSHNIANAGVNGYSRQESVLTSRMGGGVEIATTRRIGEQFLVSSIWNANSDAAFAGTQRSYFDQIENVFSSDSSDVAAGLDSLFASLNSAMLSPQDSATRQGVLNEVKNLSQRFNNINSSLEQQWTQNDSELQASTVDLNGYLGNIASINQQIRDLGGIDNAPPALLDQRDDTVAKLANLVDVSANQNSDGTLNLSLSNGQPLVVGTTAASVDLRPDPADPSRSALSLEFNGTRFDLDQQAGGSLGALLDYRDGTLSQSRQFIDELGQTMADAFNGVQTAGFDLNGAAGQPLFSYDPLDPAGTLTLAAGFSADMLAFSSDGSPGDNGNLQALVDIATAQYSFASLGGISTSMNDAYVTQVGSLGSASRQAQLDAAAAEKAQLHANNEWMSVAGVNLDEEAVNLIAYQQAYQANAKVMTAADQLFSTLLNSF
ncbi:flagellar hook-associated protein FlgK [uncultured Ferrimonas sp.]|uniref:flagellar hook-associated protein FlgK n=1 Tax=uncultured Ferrimonas sp. TaxID=432640 RepID=UPI00261B922A|nr:flagellar hook-associated protein FlgK [uncultured Ferrimonas sp.]